jgi:hypothetical protein
MDQDDICHPERLARQVEFLRQHPRVALVGSQARTMDAAGRITGRAEVLCTAAGLRWAQCFQCGFVHPATMFRREIAWTECRGYDTRIRIAQDFDLWSRMGVRHELANLPEALLDYRIHGASALQKHWDLAQREAEAVGGAYVAALFGAAAPAAGPELLHALYSFTAPAGPVARTLPGALAELHRGFLAQCPEAAGNPEVVALTRRLYWRLADILAGCRAASREAWRLARGLSPEAPPRGLRWRQRGLWAGGAEARALYRRWRRRG